MANRLTQVVPLLACAATAGCATVRAPEWAPVKPVNIGASQATVSDGYYADARAAILNRDYGRALDLLQMARRGHEQDPRILNAFGVVYDKLGRFDLSARYYAQALAVDPDSAVVKGNLAYSQQLQAHWQTQRADTGAAVAAQPAAPPPPQVAEALPSPALQPQSLPLAAPPQPAIAAPAPPPKLQIALAAPLRATPTEPSPPALKPQPAAATPVSSVSPPKPQIAAAAPLAPAALPPTPRPQPAAAPAAPASTTKLQIAAATPLRAPSTEPLPAAPPPLVAKPQPAATAAMLSPPAFAKAVITQEPVISPVNPVLVPATWPQAPVPAAAAARPSPAALIAYGPGPRPYAVAFADVPPAPPAARPVAPIARKAALPPRPGSLVLLDASGQASRVHDLRMRLRQLGWSAGISVPRIAPLTQRTVIRYPAWRERVAQALARTLPVPVQLQSCGRACNFIQVMFGADVRRWRTMASTKSNSGGR